MPTFVAAVVSAIIAALTLATVFVLRRRDRIEVRIESVALSERYFQVVLRNHGGTPTRTRLIAFDKGGA